MKLFVQSRKTDLRGAFAGRLEGRVSGGVGGFSLVELLLTLVLIVCLAAASVFSYNALHRSANLDEGLNRFQSLVRLAQAEAATTGRKVQLQFPAPSVAGAVPEPATGKPVLHQVRVMWEPDFLGAPGVFEEHSAKGWSEELVNELVGVTKVRSIQPELLQETAKPSAARLEAAPEVEAELTSDREVEDFPVITFYPDGSCDSAEILLASRNDEDHRLLEVRLSGILGSVTSRQVDQAEAESRNAGEPGTLAQAETPDALAADEDALDF